MMFFLMKMECFFKRGGSKRVERTKKLRELY